MAVLGLVPSYSQNRGYSQGCTTVQERTLSVLKLLSKNTEPNQTSITEVNANIFTWQLETSLEGTHSEAILERVML